MIYMSISGCCKLSRSKPRIMHADFCLFLFDRCNTPCPNNLAERCGGEDTSTGTGRPRGRSLISLYGSNPPVSGISVLALLCSCSNALCSVLCSGMLAARRVGLSRIGAPASTAQGGCADGDEFIVNYNEYSFKSNTSCRYHQFSQFTKVIPFSRTIPTTNNPTFYPHHHHNGSFRPQYSRLPPIAMLLNTPT
jgi:hypothetical protein